SPARLSCRSSSLKPNGSIRCKVVPVAAHKRATFPAFGGISGSTRTTVTALLSFSLIPLPQHQAAGRCGHAGQAAIAASQNFRNLARANLAFADLHQRSHQPAAHLIKKAIAFDNEGQQWSGLFHLATPDGAHGRFRVVVRIRAEGAKVMSSHKSA